MSVNTPASILEIKVRKWELNSLSLDWQSLATYPLAQSSTDEQGKSLLLWANCSREIGEKQKAHHICQGQSPENLHKLMVFVPNPVPVYQIHRHTPFTVHCYGMGNRHIPEGILYQKFGLGSQLLGYLLPCSKDV